VDYERPVRVRGYSPKVGESTECKTVSAVVSYNHANGINYMLILYQAIYIPYNDIEVNDLPKSMCKDPTTNDHAIIVDDLTITLSIIDHLHDEKVDLQGEDNHQQRTTKGRALVVEWKDGSTSWEKLADLKESSPIEVADYATASNLCEKPAFSWWVKNVLTRCKKMIGAASMKYIKRTHRFGLEIPKTVKRALEIDTENGN